MLAQSETSHTDPPRVRAERPRDSGPPWARSGPEDGFWTFEFDPDSLWWSPEMFTIMGFDAETVTPSLELVLSQLEADSARLLERQVGAWRSALEPFAAI